MHTARRLVAHAAQLVSPDGTRQHLSSICGSFPELATIYAASGDLPAPRTIGQAPEPAVMVGPPAPFPERS
jgi:hypothetical protein